MDNVKSRGYVAWDGEGINVCRTCKGEIESVEGEWRHRLAGETHEVVSDHLYVLFAMSDGEVFDYLLNPEGLRTVEILDFLWKWFRKRPGHRHVIYGGSYDYNCWMRGLARLRARLFWQEQVPIRMDRYIVEMDGRHFRMERDGHRLIVWDVWRFWQSSFVKALKMCLPAWGDVEEIAKWKEKRSDFSSATLPSILQYTKKELLALIALMQRLDVDLYEAKIGSLARLDGAGSIAAKMFRMRGVKKYMDVLPDRVKQAAYYAYAGGRAEPWKYGLHDGWFGTYDVVSAYPYAMTKLPCLKHGSWVRVTQFVPDAPFAVYRLHFKALSGCPGYPFFQRVKGGMMLYPRETEGWYWKPEIDAAIETGFGAQIDIREGWIFYPQCEHKPFHWYPEQFRFRAELKALGRMGAQLELKLGLNSGYGKTAQTLGGTESKPPPFHQPAWAGYTTSHCRGTVFRAAMQKPHAICYIATDGIGSTEPLDLKTGTELGEWEAGEYERFMLVQTGVYFLWHEGKRYDKYRGFDAGSIEPDDVIKAWRKHEQTLDVPATRFITLGSALAGHERFKHWCTWRTVPRELHLHGGAGKRTLLNGSGRPWAGLVPLHPEYIPGVIQSHPYVPKWKVPPTLERLDGVDVDVFLEEMVCYDRARRTFRESELSGDARTRPHSQSAVSHARNREIPQWLEHGRGIADDDATMRVADVAP